MGGKSEKGTGGPPEETRGTENSVSSMDGKSSTRKAVSNRSVMSGRQRD